MLIADLYEMENTPYIQKHIPVMLPEVIDHLNLHEGSCVVDCTVGLGGHAREILRHIGPGGRLIGIDRDEDSLKQARDNLKEFNSQCDLIHRDYRFIDQVLKKFDISTVDSFLFDLGISSFQLENPDRGFSFRLDGPLDMRMDKESYISAYDLVNSLSEKELSSILKNFGQERWHNRIAHHLIQVRTLKPIETTKDFSEAIQKAVPYRYQNQKIHPATRAFQAIRIAVNRELEALDIALNKAVEFLSKGGRICVISFHSLEDRIVKNTFRHFVQLGQLKLITPKPLGPLSEEIERNPRARSAKFRVAERIK